MLRISIDGVILAFAGPFEDGEQYASTYMVGSIQLPAGTHTFKVECEVVRRIAQTGQVDGICTNTVSFGSRACTILERAR